MRGSILCGRCRKPVDGDPERRCRCVGARRSYSLVIELPRDPNTGKRRQRWRSYKVPRDVNRTEAMKRASAELAKLLHQANSGTLVDATRATLLSYLREWYKKAIVPLRSEATARSYKAMIECHVAGSSIATKPLQRIRTSDLEALYATAERRSLGHAQKPARKLAAKSINVLHAVIRQALRLAQRDGLLVSNPADAATNRPRASRDQTKDAREHCWSADEARAVLAAAEAAGPQTSAFFGVALNIGARRNELLGLRWKDVNLDAGTITIAHQLARKRTDTAPTFRTTKTGTSRTVTIDDETTTRLRAHRKAQRELMMRNRSAYRDYGLVFAKESGDLQMPSAELGQPCPALIGRIYGQVLKSAGVRRIKIHGMRHTCATLLLGAGVAAHVVAQRLGHANVTQTLNVYAHALPDQQRDAADRLGALLARTSKADQAANG